MFRFIGMRCLIVSLPVWLCTELLVLMLLWPAPLKRNNALKGDSSLLDEESIDYPCYNTKWIKKGLASTWHHISSHIPVWPCLGSASNMRNRRQCLKCQHESVKYTYILNVWRSCSVPFAIVDISLPVSPRPFKMCHVSGGWFGALLIRLNRLWIPASLTQGIWRAFKMR